MIDPAAIVDPTAIIGAEPMNYRWHSRWQQLLSRGSVTIGPDVHVGPLTTVMRGAVGDTIIARGCRIGHGVNIGHDVEIGEYTLVIAHASIAGWCRIGRMVRIDMGALVKNRITIGDGARIGMGAVVICDVPAGETWAGCPARRIG